jgi:hypothetical protein
MRLLDTKIPDMVSCQQALDTSDKLASQTALQRQGDAGESVADGG